MRNIGVLFSLDLITMFSVALPAAPPNPPSDLLTVDPTTNLTLPFNLTLPISYT